MNSWRLSWHYLWSRPLGALINTLLLALGLGAVTFLMLVGHHLTKAFERDLAGIDLVVGAKGSPMQLILSGVLHMDSPTGNVPLAEVQALAQHPLVEELIPLSLGDNFAGFRIVGTQLSFLQHYKLQLAQGQAWAGPLQVVVGAQVAQQLGMQLGHTFMGSHGLGGGGHVHGDHAYQVVGILAATGGVADRLILTDLASVWKVHEDATAQDDDDRKILEEEREVTLALVRYKTPLAAISLPRYVNTQTEMQAASPAFEITRLLHMLGVGTDVLRAFALVLLLTAALSVFFALWSAVRERRGDLALLRLLGASPAKVGVLLWLEALWLGLFASGLGLLLGQAFMAALIRQLDQQGSMLTGLTLEWPPTLAAVPLLALGVASVSALLPALEAYRVSVLELLQNP